MKKIIDAARQDNNKRIEARASFELATLLARVVSEYFIHKLTSNRPLGKLLLFWSH